MRGRRRKTVDRADLEATRPAEVQGANFTGAVEVNTSTEDLDEATPPGSEFPGEMEWLRLQVERLRTTLEDIVALALSGDPKERAMQMHRRAVAGLHGEEAANRRSRTSHLPGRRRTHDDRHPNQQ